jgi:enoyl-CoA hydratase/carnithine racemase
MGRVIFEQKGPVAWMTIDNQAKLNAVNAEMSGQIVEAYREIEGNPSIRVAVVTGAGEKAFSTGGEMGSYVAGGVLGADGSGRPAGIPKPDKLSKPLIAAIRGYCIAGGFGLALGCDLRIAGSDARMGPSGLKRGVVPAAQQTERLVKLVPFGKALEILLLARYVEAEEALAIGLVQKVVPPVEVVSTAAAWAEIIAGFSPTAVQQTKKLAYDAMPMPWADAFALGAKVMEESFRTEDGREGFTAFLENRAPKFTGA